MMKVIHICNGLSCIFCFNKMHMVDVLRQVHKSPKARVMSISRCFLMGLKKYCRSSWSDVIADWPYVCFHHQTIVFDSWLNHPYFRNRLEHGQLRNFALLRLFFEIYSFQHAKITE